MHFFSHKVFENLSIIRTTYRLKKFLAQMNYRDFDRKPAVCTRIIPANEMLFNIVT